MCYSSINLIRVPLVVMLGSIGAALFSCRGHVRGTNYIPPPIGVTLK